MLEDNQLTDQTVKDMADIIYGKELKTEIGEYNYQLGKIYFSYATLEEKLTEIIDRLKKV